MKSSAKNIKLTSYDELFQNDAAREDERREKVLDIPLKCPVNALLLLK